MPGFQSKYNDNALISFAIYLGKTRKSAHIIIFATLTPNLNTYIANT